MTINRRADKRTAELEAELEALEALEAGMNEGRPEPKIEREEITSEVTDNVVELSPDEATWKKRFGDLRRHSQKIEKDLKDKLTEMEARLTEAPTASSLTTEQIKKWAETNPQANAIIRAIAAEQSGDKGKALNEIEEVKTQLAKDKAEAKVRKAHPDFDEIIADTIFHDWAETQPEFVQDKIYDNLSAEDTIWAISLYKKEKNIRPLTDSDTAKAVKGSSKASPASDKGKGRFTESKVSKMSPAEFEKNYDAIMEEMRTNPSFYDMSGGAR